MPLALDNVQMSNSFNKVCAIGNAECFSIGIRCYSLQITNKKKTLQSVRVRSNYHYWQPDNSGNTHLKPFRLPSCLSSAPVCFCQQKIT